MVFFRTSGTRSLVWLAALCVLTLSSLQHDLVQAAKTVPDAVACQLAIAESTTPSSSAGPVQSADSAASDTMAPTDTTSSAPDAASPSQASTGSGTSGVSDATASTDVTSSAPDVASPSQASTGTGTRFETTNSASAGSVFTVCRSSVSEGDRNAGIQVITDDSCATSPTTGCFDSVCRYCQMAPTAQSTQYNQCSDYGYFFAYTASTTSTTTSVASSNCTATITEAEAAAGVWLVSDLTCVSGGTGCSGTTCRYCQTRSTPHSQGLLECSNFGYSTSTSAVSTTSASGNSHSTSGSSASGTDANADGNGDDFFWPEPPSGSFLDGSSSDPFGQTDALASCTMTVSSGDAAVGLQIVTDSTCANGGLGCASSLCRFCKYFETAQSTVYVTCTSLGFYFATPTPATTSATPMTTTATTTSTPVTTAPTPVPTTTAPVTTTATPVTTTGTPVGTRAAPAIVLTCLQTVSSGDAAVGIDMVTDISCFDGGVGCLSNICRYCKRWSTTQSTGFVNCSSIDTTIGFDITFVALPVFATPPPTTTSPATTIPTLTSATCSVSSGDAAVGLSAYVDATCASGGLGCYSGTCRFCRMWTTTQSQVYYICPSARRLLSEVNEAVDTPSKSSRLFQLATLGAGGFCVAGLVAMMALAIKSRLKRRVRTDVVQASGSSQHVMAHAIPSSDEDDDDEDVHAAVVDSTVLATDL